MICNSSQTHTSGSPTNPGLPLIVASWLKKFKVCYHQKTSGGDKPNSVKITALGMWNLTHIHAHHTRLIRILSAIHKMAGECHKAVMPVWLHPTNQFPHALPSPHTTHARFCACQPPSNHDCLLLPLLFQPADGSSHIVTLVITGTQQRSFTMMVGRGQWV